jgi:hypothetical protein
MPAPSSQAQARFFGAIAGGLRKVKGLTPMEARRRLRGVTLSGLPRQRAKTTLTGRR